MLKYVNLMNQNFSAAESLMTLPALIDQIKGFINNPVWLACIFSWLIAQFIKTGINLVYGRIRSLPNLFENLIWKTGGMPSSHSALVTSLCVTIGFRHGIDSDIFVFSLMFFFVVIRDAFGVRRSSGMQAKKINEIGKELQNKKYISSYSQLKEVLGHTPMEVICGCILGFFVGFAFSILD